MKKKILLWVVLAILTHVLAFIGGHIKGRYVAEYYFAKEFDKADAHVVMGHYSAYRDIALGIQEAHYSRALCEAEMMATTMFQSLAVCVADAECKDDISVKAHRFAPEILGEKSLPIVKRTNCN